MRTLYSFSATRFGEPEFYLRPFLGSPGFWGSFFGMTTLLAFSLVIALKSWKHLSVGVLGWMAFSIFWHYGHFGKCGLLTRGCA